MSKAQRLGFNTCFLAMNETTEHIAEEHFYQLKSKGEIEDMMLHVGQRNRPRDLGWRCSRHATMAYITEENVIFETVSSGSGPDRDRL